MAPDQEKRRFRLGVLEVGAQADPGPESRAEGTGPGYIGDRYSIATALWTVTVPSAFAAGAAFMRTFFLRRSRRSQSTDKACG